MLNLTALYLGCHDYRTAVLSGHTATMGEAGRISSPERGEQLAAQLVAAFQA